LTRQKQQGRDKQQKKGEDYAFLVHPLNPHCYHSTHNS